MFDIEIHFLVGLEEDEKILISNIASWKIFPGKFEINTRGVKIRRKTPVFTNNGIRLDMIKINGIGYQKLISQSNSFLTKEAEFSKPSMTNYLIQKNNTFTTLYPKNNTLVNLTGNFDPSGCYLELEIQNILKKSLDLEKFKSKYLNLLIFYGYGFYKDKNMSHDGERGSFLISGEPEEKRFLQMLKEKGLTNIFLDPIKLLDLITPLILGLKDLHNFGYAHLQPHFDNFYILDKKCYLVDFETFFKNKGNEIEFMLARALDLNVLIDNYNKILRSFGISDEKFRDNMADFSSGVLSIYLNKKISFVEIQKNKEIILSSRRVIEVERKNGSINDFENLFMILYQNL